jgi:hypothetical protein
MFWFFFHPKFDVQCINGIYFHWIVRFDTLLGFKTQEEPNNWSSPFNKELFTKFGCSMSGMGASRSGRFCSFRLWVRRRFISTLEGIQSEQLTEIIVQFFWKVLHEFKWSKNDNETLTNKFHSTKHPAKGERKNKRRTPKSELLPNIHSFATQPKFWLEWGQKKPPKKNWWLEPSHGRHLF